MKRIIVPLISVIFSLLLSEKSVAGPVVYKFAQNLPTPITILEVQDGDTELVKFTQTSAIGDIRIACIDAPEVPHSTREKNLKDPAAVTQFKWGKAAKSIVSQWLKPATVIQAMIVDYDLKYNRNVARISVDGEELGLKLVENGYALMFPKYLDRCTNAAALTAAEQSAREQKLGIHSEPVMVPEEFRKAVLKMQ